MELTRIVSGKVTRRRRRHHHRCTSSTATTTTATSGTSIRHLTPIPPPPLQITKMQKKSLGALITIEVHARDVVGKLRDDGVDSANDFARISQLRYEIIGDGHEASVGSIDVHTAAAARRPPPR